MIVLTLIPFAELLRMMFGKSVHSVKELSDRIQTFRTDINEHFAVTLKNK